MSIQEFIAFCKERHDVFANQKYDTVLPYSMHLEYVNAQFHRYKYLLPLEDHFAAWAGCWGHDLIEDTRLTYNEIAFIIGKQVGDIIYCCTEEKGRNRDERHSDKYYTELATNRLAVFVKLCDIIANVSYSILTNSSMYKKHKKEHDKTYSYLYREEFKEMFDYLDNLFTLKAD